MRGNIISINDYVGHYEVPFGKSMTVPDQTLSLREILRNVVEGRGTGLIRISPLEYDPEDDDDFADPTLEPGFDRLDANLIASQSEYSPEDLEGSETRQQEELGNGVQPPSAVENGVSEETPKVGDST